MARRYGRRQRRAHREQIAALEAAEVRLKNALNQESRARRDLERKLDEWNKDIASLLGPFSAFRREPPITKFEKYECNPTIPFRQPISALSFDPSKPLEMIPMTVERLIRIAAHLGTDDLMSLRRVITVWTTDAKSSSWSIAIDEMQWRAMIGNDIERFSRYLADMIARPCRLDGK